MDQIIEAIRLLPQTCLTTGKAIALGYLAAAHLNITRLSSLSNNATLIS
jgi:hypothetical protein